MADTYSNTLANLIDMVRLPLEGAIIKKIIETSPMINYFPYTAKGSHTYVSKQIEKMPQTQSRLIGNPFSAEATPKFSPKLVQMGVFGNKFGTDRVNEGLPAALGGISIAEQIGYFAQSFGLDWKKFVISGSRSASGGKEFDGLKEMITAAQSISMTTATGATDFQSATIEKITAMFDEAIDLTLGNPTVILANRTVRRLIKSRFVDANNDAAANKFRWENLPMPGIVAGTTVNVRTLTYDGIPVVAPDNDSQDAEVLGFSEDSDGTGTGAFTSIWFITDRYKFVGQYPEGLRTYTRPGEIGTVIDVDFPMTMDLTHPKAISRVYGIEAA